MELKNFLDKTPLILIVDDIPKNLQILSSILNSEGFQISFASNGSQALTVVETSMPDLILLDIMMPDMDGYEVCEKLQSNPDTRDIPVIFLTGKAESDDIIKGFKTGAVDFVTKPFNSIELISRVKTHVKLKLSNDAIKEYNSRLLETRDKLQNANASKDKFFSIISHDLRGPFSGFIGLSELLADEIEILEPKEISNIAQSMNTAAKRLFNLLENLLEWSRTQMGRMEYYPMNIDIAEAADRAIQLMQNNIEDKKISVSSNVKKGLQVMADNNMLNTIFRNLLGNAIKFTPAGGEIEISAEMNGNTVHISVKDSGIGISENDIKKLFRIDQKFSTPGTNNEYGTGLGLILCRELVEKQGGSISAVSEKGKGSAFTFTLPAIE
ncbi:MAG: response regulator [Candidatus Kapaibacterium sp.]